MNFAYVAADASEGNLGKHSAQALSKLGYNVLGWARRDKNIDGVTVYFGEDQLNDFLAKTKILVCMLPQTELTENILNYDIFKAMPMGGFLINVGRGENLIENDLIKALDEKQLEAATLDVFRNEPLPLNHPFWAHPRILITSHTASAIEPKVGGQIIANNISAFMKEENVPDIVDIVQGY